MYMTNTIRAIFDQLSDLLRRLTQEEYSAPLDLLSGNSIGKHVRHVIEFFDLLANSAEGDIINYDKRAHDKFIEIDNMGAGARIKELHKKLERIDSDRALLLEATYGPEDDEKMVAKTTFKRELAYNIEHAVHHMAIIKMAVKASFSHVGISKNFGVAYSTQKYRSS